MSAVAERLPEAPVRARSGGRPLRAAFHRSLRDNRRAPLSWGLPLGALCALVVGVYPSIAGSLDEMMKNYPKGLKEAFGITELNSLEAYLNAEMFSLIVPLALAFFAVRSAARAISVAEERGYLDTSLSAPLPRRLLVAGSFAASALMSAAVLAMVFALTMVAALAGGIGISTGRLAAGVASVWALAVFFAGVAVLVAGFLHRSAPVTGIAAGTLVGMYVVDLVGKLAHPIEPLRTASVFKYYGSALTDGLDPLAFAGLTLCGVGLAIAGALLFERRDVFA